MNYSFGYSVGDELLKQLVAKLQAVIHPNDMLARLGGDQFAILLNKVPDEIQVNRLLEKVLVCFEQPFKIQDHEITISASIGISYGQADDDTSEIALKNAEIAIHQAREQY